MKIKHVIASKKDVKPTIMNGEIEKYFGQDAIFLVGDNIEFFYPEFNMVINYVRTREGKTWYGDKPLPTMPTIGNPLHLEVSLYVRLLSNQLSPIRLWAAKRGLLEHGTPETQFLKLLEEVGELSQGMLKKNRMEFSDAIGDIVVVLTNLAAMQGLNIEECINLAYNQIKDRQGKMENSTFVKNQ